MTTTSTAPAAPRTVSVETIGAWSLRFETETCTRCAGAGHMAGYEGIDGGKCFKCGRSGQQLTRRGTAARKRFDESRAANVVAVRDVEVGMRVGYARTTEPFRTVTEAPREGRGAQIAPDGARIPLWEIRTARSIIMALPDAEIAFITPETTVDAWNAALRSSGAYLIPRS
jgi:hypothetical protein